MTERDVVTRPLTRYLWYLLIALALGAAWLSVLQTPGRDSSAFIHIAQGLFTGDLPYLDRWDHKPPLIYLIDALGLLISGGELWGVWLVEGIALSLTAFLAFSTLHAVFGTAAAGFATTAILIYLHRLLDGGNMTEEYALLCQFSALWLFVLDARQPQHSAAAFFIGLLAAVAFLLKPNLVGLWVAIGFTWLIYGPDALSRITRAVLGAVTGFAVILGWLALNGALQAFYDAVFVYNIAYAAGSGIAQRLDVIRYVLQQLPMLYYIALLWPVAALYLVRDRSLTRGQPMDSMLRLGLFLLPIEWIMVTTSGRTYSHYFMSLLPVTAIYLGGFALLIEQALRAASPRPQMRTIAAVVTLIALFSALLTLVHSERPRYAETFARVHEHLDQQHIIRGPWAEVAAHLAAHVPPQAPVMAWGAQALVHILSGLPASSRYFYHYPLVTSGYSDDTHVNGFLSDLARNPPRIIVDTANPLLPPLDPVARLRWNRNLDSSEYGYHEDAFRSLLAFIENNYVRDEDVAGFAIYALRDGPSD